MVRVRMGEKKGGSQVTNKGENGFQVRVEISKGFEVRKEQGKKGSER